MFNKIIRVNIIFYLSS